MKFFIALSFEDREELKPVIDQVKNTLTASGHQYEIFVEKQVATPVEPKQLMSDALALLSQCDGLIAEITHKAVGVGIEVGLAAARDMPILVIRQKGAEPSVTLEGISDRLIEYESPSSLGKALSSDLPKLKKKEIDKNERDRLESELLTEFARHQARIINEKYSIVDLKNPQVEIVMEKLTLELLQLMDEGKYKEYDAIRTISPKLPAELSQPLTTIYEHYFRISEGAVLTLMQTPSIGNVPHDEKSKIYSLLYGEKRIKIESYPLDIRPFHTKFKETSTGNTGERL